MHKRRWCGGGGEGGSVATGAVMAQRRAGSWALAHRRPPFTSTARAPRLWRRRSESGAASVSRGSSSAAEAAAAHEQASKFAPQALRASGGPPALIGLGTPNSYVSSPLTYTPATSQ